MFLVGFSHWRSCYLECASAWGFAILHLDITAAMMMMMWVQIENRPSHSHAPIEASKRNPSRRLMQTVSSKPLATPSFLWNSSEGCSCRSCVLRTFQQYQFIFQSIFFFFGKLLYYWLLLQPLFVDNRRQVFSLVCSALLPSGGQVLLALKKASVPKRINTNTFNYLKWRWNLRSSNVHIPQNLPTQSYGKKPYDVLTCDRCQCTLFHSICTDLSSASEEMSLFPSNLNLCQHMS